MFKYWVEVFRINDIDPINEELERYLNWRGESGWELVSIINIHNSRILRLVFKTKIEI